MSAPRRPTFCPRDAVMTRSLGASRSVSSTMTTASAPAGSGAPVAISEQSPPQIGPLPHLPVNTVRRSNGASGSGVLAPTCRRQQPHTRPSPRDRTAARRSRLLPRAQDAPSASRSGSLGATRRDRWAERRWRGPRRVEWSTRRSCHFPRSRAHSTSQFSPDDVADLGRINRVMASRTACSDPGKAKNAVVPIDPAVARLNIAAAPISWKLNILKSSPNPSRRLVEERGDRLVGAVTLGDARSAGRDDTRQRPGWTPPSNVPGCAPPPIPERCAGADVMAGALQQLDDRVPTGVVAFGSGVADGDNRAPDRGRGVFSVRRDAHRFSIGSRGSKGSRRSTGSRFRFKRFRVQEVQGSPVPVAI